MNSNEVIVTWAVVIGIFTALAALVWSDMKDLNQATCYDQSIVLKYHDEDVTCTTSCIEGNPFEGALFTAECTSIR